MASIVTSELNQMLDSLFEYVDWYKAYDEADDFNKSILFNKYTIAISSLLVERKNKCEEYFDTVVDQPIYATDDYLRLRKFLVYWYSALSVLTEKEKQVSEINFIDKDLLLRSLGYDLYYLHSDTAKNTLATQISDIWSEKGTYLAMAKVLSLTDITDFAIYEYWLERDKYEELVFHPVIIEGLSYSTGEYEGFQPMDRPFASVTDKDPHWQTTVEEIEAAEANNDIGLPSLSPYIGVAGTNKWMETTSLAMSWVNRVCDDIWKEYVRDPYNFDIQKYRKYYFAPSNTNLSIIELYVAAGYMYNIMYERDVSEREAAQSRNYFCGDEATLYNSVQYISAHNQVFRRTNSRHERDEVLKRIENEWKTKDRIFSESQEENLAILQRFNPDFLAIIDNAIAIGDGYEFLGEVLMMLDYIVSHELEIRCNFLFMLYESPKDRVSTITKIFNYFKPIHVRLLELVTYIVFKDLPGDCYGMDESVKEEIEQLLVDYYLLCKDKVQQKISMILDGNENFMIIHDVVQQILHMKMHDYAIIRSGEHDVKVELSQPFAEFYAIFDDVEIFEQVEYKDRLYMYEAIMHHVEETMREVYGLNDDPKDHLVQERVEHYRLCKDRIIPSFTQRLRDYLRMLEEHKHQVCDRFFEMYRDSIRSKYYDIHRVPVYDNYTYNYKDSVSIIENSSGIVFDTDTWTDDGDDYFITYDSSDDSRIGSVLASIRDQTRSEVYATTLYDDVNNTISLRSHIPFSGSLVLKEIDYRFDFDVSSWYDDMEAYTYTVNLSEYGVADGNYIVRITDSSNATRSGVIISFTPTSIVLTSGEPFEGHILLGNAEASKSFDKDRDWEWDGATSTWRLTLNPHLNGLRSSVMEYIASVRDSEGQEVALNVRYDMIGTLTLASAVKISGNVVVSGDPAESYIRN